MSSPPKFQSVISTQPDAADAINELLEPMRERRAQYEGPEHENALMDILRTGCARAIEKTEETLAMAKQAASLSFFDRRIDYV